jgi:hypothetical protein
MAGNKNSVNTQWGRISDGLVGGVWEGNDNDGREPLVDAAGRQWVVSPQSVDFLWMMGAEARFLAPVDVAAGTLVQLTTDLQKRLQVNHEQSIAGENLVHHYLETINKPVPSLQNSYDDSHSAAAEFVRTAKTSPGRIYRASITSANAANRWAQLHNTAGAPAGGAVPLRVIRLQQFECGCIEFPEQGMYLDTGITVAVSTTQNTYTAAAADHLITILYK